MNKKSQTISDDLNFILFNDLYHKIESIKGKRKALFIVEEAISMVGRRGFHKFSLKDLAKQLDTTQSSILYYFDNMAEILNFAIMYVRLKYQASAVEEMKKHKSFRGKLEAYINTCFSWPHKQTRYSKFWLAFLHKTTTDKSMKELNDKMALTGFKRLLALLEGATKESNIEVNNLEQKCRFIYTYITGLLFSETTESSNGPIRNKEDTLMFCMMVLGIDK